MTKLITRLLAGAVMIPLIVGCGPPAKIQSERNGIVSLAPHVTETIFELGQGHRLIAVSTFCDYPAGAADLPKAGDYLNPDFERITTLNPEMLIVAGRHQDVTKFAEVRSLPVLNVHMDSLDTIHEGINVIGEALQCTEEAAALRDRIKKELQEVRQSVAHLPRASVLIVTMRNTHDLNTIYTAGGDSFVSQVVQVAGGDNMYGDAPETYFEASKETIVMSAPDVILEFHAGEKMSESEKERYIADWEQLASIPAVRNRRIHVITESYTLRPGPRVAQIARIVANAMHPDLELPE